MGSVPARFQAFSQMSASKECHYFFLLPFPTSSSLFDCSLIVPEPGEAYYCADRP